METFQNGILRSLKRPKPHCIFGVVGKVIAELASLLILAGLFDGRNQLKANYLMSVETSKGLLNEFGTESLVSGTLTSPSAAAQKIDSVATADVVNVSMCQHPQVFLNHCVRFFMEN